MAHILECSPLSAGSLVGGNGSLLQARQFGQHCWRVWQPAFSTDRQRKFGKLHRLSVLSHAHNSPLLGTDSKHSGQQKQRRSRRTTSDESPLKKGLVVVQSSLGEDAPPSRTLSSRILPGMPAAAVFFATGLARAAEEIELPPSVVPNDDEISNSIIAVLFTLGLVALSVLTLGVSCTP